MLECQKTTEGVPYYPTPPMTPNIRKTSASIASTETARIGDGCSKAWTGSDVHAGEEDGMLDVEELGERRGNGGHVCS